MDVFLWYFISATEYEALLASLPEEVPLESHALSYLRFSMGIFNLYMSKK